MDRKKKITIIGGGITGLSTAFYLQQELQKRNLVAEIIVCESSDAFGGRIRTVERDGFLFEKGPDSFLARKIAIIDLIKELGIEEELTGTNPAKRRNFILHHNQLYQMPEGMVMGIPSKLKPFIASNLISMRGKLRAMLDFFLPKRKGNQDESLGHFMERRLGQEVLYRIAEPLLSGIYAGDMYRLSIQATFPQFAQMEREHGSLIRATMKSRGQAAPNLPGLPPAAGKSVFLTFRRGLQTLVQALVGALENSQVRLFTDRTLTAITVKSESEGGGYQLTYNDSEIEESDIVILTLPTHQAATLLEHTQLAKQLKQIEYVSVANVVLAYRRNEIDYDFNGSGFVIPRGEKRFITACTWTSEKWLHAASHDHVLLRCYVGRAGDEAWQKMSEDQIIERARQDIYETMGINAEPLFTEVTRLQSSMPQYDVGHLQKVADIRSTLQQELPNVWMTGAAFHGVGLPDCVRQGKETALEIASHLANGDGSCLPKL